MERYLRQLLTDIKWARDNVPAPWWHFMPSEEEEEHLPKPWSEDEENAPVQSLEKLTGINQIQLPPASRLNEFQISRLLNALKEMLSAYNCHVVFQRADVPPQIQYEIIRLRFPQEMPQLTATDYFFSFCDPDTDRSKCLLGDYCECRFLDHMLTRFDDPEEDLEEADFREHYMKRKFGPDWEEYIDQQDWDGFGEDLTEDEDLDFWGEEEDL